MGFRLSGPLRSSRLACALAHWGPKVSRPLASEGRAVELLARVWLYSFIELLALLIYVFMVVLIRVLAMYM